MNRIALFLLAVGCYGQAGTALPGPVIVLPKADNSAPLPVRLMDTTNKYVDIISPVTLTGNRVLTPQDASYVMAGIDITQTFTGQNTFTDQSHMADFVNFGVYSGSFTKYWSIDAQTANLLHFRDSGSNLRMYLDASGVPNGGGSGVQLNAPSIFAASTQVGTPTLYALAITSQTADVLTVASPGGGTKYLQVAAGGAIAASSLAGSGTRCVQVSNVGVVTPASGACGGGDMTLTTNQYVTGTKTFDANQEIAQFLDFGSYSGSFSKHFSIESTTANLLAFRDSGSGLVMSLNTSGVPSGGGSGYQFTAPGVLLQTTQVGTPTLFILERTSQTADIVEVTDPGGSTKYLQVAAGGALSASSLAGGGTKCLQTDNSGVITAYSASCASGSGANTTLSNLGTTAINAALLSASDNTIDIGSTTNRFDEGHFASLVRVSTSSGGTRWCQASGGSLQCSNGGVTMFSATSLGALASYSLSGAGTRCVQVDNNGEFAVASAGCGVGTVTSVTASSPLASSGGATPNITIQVASTSQNGYLSSTDWNTFNGKANSTLNNLGTTSINADLLFSSDNARDFGTAATRANDGFFGGVVRSSTAASSTSYCEIASAGGSLQCLQAGTTTFSVARLTGQILSFALSGGGTRCVENDNSGNISSSSLTGNCVTTAGGQSIAGTTTLSTVSVSTAIAGTHNMSGNETVTGNFYNRSVAGSGISCAGVADGWTAWDTTGQYLMMCAGGNRYRVNLASY